MKWYDRVWMSIFYIIIICILSSCTSNNILSTDDIVTSPSAILPTEVSINFNTTYDSYIDKDGDLVIDCGGIPIYVEEVKDIYRKTEIESDCFTKGHNIFICDHPYLENGRISLKETENRGFTVYVYNEKYFIHFSIDTFDKLISILSEFDTTIANLTSEKYTQVGYLYRYLFYDKDFDGIPDGIPLPLTDSAKEDIYNNTIVHWSKGEDITILSMDAKDDDMFDRYKVIWEPSELLPAFRSIYHDSIGNGYCSFYIFNDSVGIDVICKPDEIESMKDVVYNQILDFKENIRVDPTTLKFYDKYDVRYYGNYCYRHPLNENGDFEFFLDNDKIICKAINSTIRKQLDLDIGNTKANADPDKFYVGVWKKDDDSDIKHYFVYNDKVMYAVECPEQSLSYYEGVIIGYINDQNKQ